ncbi:hypothetical protein GCM10010992_24430 [Cloacibacterium rupense]|uniref:L,D-transpeptidase catalytic domain n=1 Tax=Cloacibacterium rupense TaxID=517423 RepID=A0ABQ2NNT0_9FLAO|nr:murein L,D-transpeptidase catalytic domain family protein [Cloacibacterium rupense]GGP05991.1 hypothetical protein GCM10010992_24430 [Cloacibacterium rupense]
MKNLVFLSLLLLFSCDSKSQEVSKNSSKSIPSEKIVQIKNFVKDTKYNQDLAIFINFRIPSNKFRFFIYDLKNDKILEKAIVAHGSGSVVKGSNDLVFSNVKNSYQSSLGKYQIGSSYVGTFGKSYRLIGLDKTNSNAVKRAIVIHPYYCISDVETQNLACLSLGCPMLSPNFFKVAEKYIDGSKKPIILYAFY